MRTQRFNSFVLGLLAPLASTLLGCGGGGGALDAPSVQQDVRSQQADARSVASALPQSYIRIFNDASGWAGGPVYNFLDASRGRVIDSLGRFVAGYRPTPLNPPQAFYSGVFQSVGDGEVSFSRAVTPNGIVIGGAQADDTQSAFVMFSLTGETHFQPDVEPEFVSETGLVGGHGCTVLGDPLSCYAFHWSPRDQAVTQYPNFHAIWMNNAGVMLGRHEPQGAPRRLATVDRQGAIVPVSFDPTQDHIATPRFIADDGAIFLDTQSAEDAPPTGDAIVLIAECVPIIVGRGTAPRPARCDGSPCVERTSFTGFSATGHAVGVHSWHYRDESGAWQTAAEAGFHWSASDGATAITVAGSTGLPGAVNAQGAVIGTIAGEREPFLWAKDSDGMRLRTVLYPGSDPETLGISVHAIGDAGHLLVTSHEPGDQLSFHTVFAPEPAM